MCIFDASPEEQRHASRCPRPAPHDRQRQGGGCLRPCHHRVPQAARTAQSLAAGATPRERSHIAALTAWTEGELDRTIALWESILRTDPLDVVAFRLAHFASFWLGRPQDMVSSVERVIPAWSEDIPGYASILACHCFAHEEAGNYRAAEPSGRRAIELDPGDLWAAHAVAHVLEMQGRRTE